MTETADAVIIGGGVMGCSILYSLAERGMTNTVLLEKGDLCSGSTSRSMAVLRMHYSNDVTANLAWRSLQIFRDFCDIVGRPSGYTKTGYLLILNESDRLAMIQNITMQQAIGIATSELAVNEAEELLPMLRLNGNEIFAYEPQSGYADPYSVTLGYGQRAREMGAILKDDTLATRIEVTKGKVSSVVTTNGRINTDTVVVAAGPWSASLLSQVGVDTPLRTLRHQVVMIQRPESMGLWHPMLGDVVHSLSVRPDSNNLTLIGVGEEEYVTPGLYNQGVDMEVAEGAFASLVARMPGLSKGFFRGGWSGLFTTTPDWHPILDGVDGLEGLYCAIGFSGHGFKLSPLIGLVMAELITDGRASTVDISQLNLNRFAEGKPLKSRYKMQVLA